MSVGIRHSVRIGALAPRSTRDLLEIAEQLKTAEAGLRSLHEPWADTTSPAGRMVLIVFAGIAEFERELIHERTSAGRSAAKSRGVRFGRPSKLTSDQIALARRLIGEGTSVPEVSKILKVHRTTPYRMLEAAVQGVVGRFRPMSVFCSAATRTPSTTRPRRRRRSSARRPGAPAGCRLVWRESRSFRRVDSFRHRLRWSPL